MVILPTHCGQTSDYEVVETVAPAAAFESAVELKNVWAKTETGDDGDTASTGDSSTELLASWQKSPSPPKKFSKSALCLYTSSHIYTSIPHATTETDQGRPKQTTLVYSYSPHLPQLRTINITLRQYCWLKQGQYL